MKRIISLVLTMVLFVACLVVPVMADETNLPYLELLDYGYIAEFNVVDNVASGSMVRTTLPYKMTVYNFDILVHSSVEITSATIWNGSFGIPSEILHLDGDLYRIHGSFYGDSVSGLVFQFEFLSGLSSNLVFHSVRLWLNDFEYSSTTVSGTVNAMGLPNQFLYPSYPSSPYISWSYSDWAHYQGAYTDGMFTGNFRFTDWKKYDFLELQLNAITKNISSISAYLGDQIVPVEVSIIESSGSTPGNFYINISADMRGFRRDTDDILTFVIDGIADFEMTNQISIFDAVGKILVSAPSPWMIWFNRLQGWLSSGFSSVVSGLSSLSSNISSYISNQTSVLSNSLSFLGSSIGGYISDQTTSITNSFTSLQSHITDRFNALRGWVSSGYMTMTLYIETWGQNISSTITSGVDRILSALSPNGSANEFNDKVQQQGSELENMAGAMGAVTRPDVSTAIPDIGGYLTVSGPVTLAAVFDPFWKNSYILRLLLGSLAVSVAFTVVYGGKK